MYQGHPNPTERSASTAGALLLVIPMLMMFAHLGDVRILPRSIESVPMLIIPADEPPPPPVKVVREYSPVKVAIAAPGAPARRSDPTPIVAPEPRTFVQTFQPIVAAPAAGEGFKPTSGAARDGTGTGAAGSGNGAGGVMSKAAEPVMLRGVSYSDYPMDLQSLWPSGLKITTRLRIGKDGRIKDCVVTDSFGSRSLDRQTCRLLKFKGRFKPALDDAGRPIEADFGYAVVGLRTPEAPALRRR